MRLLYVKQCVDATVNESATTFYPRVSSVGQFFMVEAKVCFVIIYVNMLKDI